MNQKRFQANKENSQTLLNIKTTRAITRAFNAKELNLNNHLKNETPLISPQIKDANTSLAEDPSNPQHVPEFQEEIWTFLKTIEISNPVNAFYMNNQADINPKMRSILIDWLVDVHIKFKLLSQSLFLTVNLIDRFLAKETVARQQLQLVGITSLMLVCKFEEIYPPLLKDYVAVCDGAYSRQQILEMEDHMIISLNFDLMRTSCFTFLEQLQLKINLEPRAFVFARYILENSLFDLNLLKYNNVQLVGGSIFLVNKIFKRGNWKMGFEDFTGIDESDARQFARDLFLTMQKMESVNLTAVKRKFGTPEMFEVAKYRIEKAHN